MPFFVIASDIVRIVSWLFSKISSSKFIDDFIIIPGAMGCLLTGLIYSVFTNWGWFKYNWIIVKWCINIYGVIFGTFWLGPWLNSLLSISKTEGMLGFSNMTYLHNQEMLYY